ncbi:MAG: hypothetical protein Q8Q17_01450, partial [bacterium]|nr:hypothetical protein [bacterium]
MQTLIKILSFQPFVAELSIVFVALIAALFLSFWGGRKLFISLAAKSRRAASVAAFIWYILLFFYFSIVIFILPHAILIDLGFSQNDIDRLYFAAGNYPVVFFFIFLIVGAAMLFVSIKKRTARGELVESASIPAPT